MQTYEEKPNKFKSGQIVKHKKILERINQPKISSHENPGILIYPVYIVATKSIFV